MIELIKKIMYTGVGAASMTKDKIEEIGKEIIVQGKLSEREGRDFIAGMIKKSAETRTEMRQQVEEIVRESIKKMNLATGDDIQALEAKIQELAKALQDKE